MPVTDGLEVHRTIQLDPNLKLRPISNALGFLVQWKLANFDPTALL
jgi:hypothetical protein